MATKWLDHVKVGINMKYIRTKNHIYDIDNLYVAEELNGKPYCVKGTCLCIYKDRIIEEADTIKQLVDVYIETWFGRSSTVKGKYIFDGEEGGLRKNLFFTSKDMEIYGAIWVTGEQGEPILKSVAKMNKEGELELLWEQPTIKHCRKI